MRGGQKLFFFLWFGPGVGPELCTYMLSTHYFTELRPPDKGMRVSVICVHMCVSNMPACIEAVSLH